MTVEKDWTRDIKDRLSRHETTAPVGLLDDVRQEMARRGLKPGQGESGTARLVPMMAWRRVAAAVAVVAVVGAGLYVTRPFKGDIKEIARESREVASGQLASDHSSFVQERDAGSGSLMAIGTSAAMPTSLEGHRMAEGAGSRLEATSEASMTLSDTLVAESGLRERQTEEGPVNEHGREKPRATEAYSLKPSEYGYERVNRVHTPLAFSAYFSSVGSASAASNGYAVSMMSSDVKCNGPMAGVTDHMNYVMLMSTSQEVHAHHRQPIKAGLSLRVPLTERWSATVGIDYSYLSSDMDVVSVSGVSNCDQQLHYMGVPVMMNYSLWHSRIFNVYLSAGGEMQYLVHGKIKWHDNGRSTTEGAKQGTPESSVSDHRPQWSVGAMAGAEIRIVKGLSIYAEPGLSYYFDNGSSVRNIYKDKPLNFSLNLGMRWTVSD